MKRILIISIIMAGLLACENQENLFPDHEYLNPDGTGTGKFYGVYFGEQYPVRTLVLGHERFENPDNDSIFHIGVSIGGMYTNKKDWRVDYIVDKKLADSVIIGTTGTTNDTALVLPDAYYTISPTGSVTIPAGSFNGLVEVKLKRAFFEDPKAITKKYVVPLRITGTDADTILSGKPKLGYDYDTRRAGDFEVTPRNFTLFVIKFINQYHGNYFHRGAVTYDGATAPTVYRSQYLEWNATRSLVTNSQFGVTLDGIANNKGGAFKMNLTFSGENVTISPVVGATYAVSGSGKFYSETHANAETIAGKKYPTIYLDYTYTVGVLNYSAKDTLVRRERGIKFEFVDASAVKPFNKIPIK